MTTTTTTSSDAYSETTIPSGWDEVPCVQYGFPEGKGPKRSPKLKTVFEPVPEGAHVASPVYLLSPDQYQRQDRFETGYEVKGVSSIAKELQDKCEEKGRVLYPIHIESDTYHAEDPETLIGWFQEFIESSLGVPFHDCTLYFSGRRSIHAHVPRFVHGEEHRERLKRRAETFCDETGADLDLGLYDPKRIFRLPGVTHADSTLPKVEIKPEWGHTRIIREAAEADVEPPASYAEVLRDVFAVHGCVTMEADRPPVDEPHALFNWLDTDEMVLALPAEESPSEEREIEKPLVELEDPPEDASKAEVIQWAKYGSKEFSPYALADGNGRSVAVVTVKGGAFAREDVTIGNANRPVHALIPAYFYGAQGCAGEEFTKVDEHAPLQLSKTDYEKWDYDIGDHVVIIGGNSGSSVIHHVNSWQARVVGHALTGEGASRQAALDYLEDEGYDVGSAGSSYSHTSRSSQEQRTADHIWPAREDWQRPAEGLQRRAEQEGITTLDRVEKARVAGRVLRYGWDPAWEWFQQQFGASFKPDVTWEQFRNIIEAYPEDYKNVEVPDRPV